MTTKLYGPFYSTYARTVRLLLEEKGAPYELIMVDLLKGETKEPAHLARQPFGQVPAIEHDGHRLYETTAIARYLDRVLPGPELTPLDPWDAARMDQIIGIINSHAYASMVTITFVQRVITPMMGGAADDAAVAAAQPKARLCLAEIERIMEGGPWLVGAEVSLADLFLLPVLDYYRATPEGGAALAEHSRVAGWLDRFAARPSAQATVPKLG